MINEKSLVAHLVLQSIFAIVPNHIKFCDQLKKKKKGIGTVIISQRSVRVAFIFSYRSFNEMPCDIKISCSVVVVVEITENIRVPSNLIEDRRGFYCIVYFLEIFI